MYRMDCLDVGANGTAYLKLWFAGAYNGQQSKDVYLFLNDDHGQNEECFLFQCHA